MVTLLRQNAVQIILVIAAFLLFLGSGSGLLNFNLHAGGIISLNTGMQGPASGSSSLPEVLKSAEFIVLLVSGTVLSVVLPMVSPIGASVLTLIATLPTFYLGYRNAGSHPMIPMEFGLLTILVIFGISVLLSYFRLTHSREKIIGIFSQYVPPQLAAEIARRPERASLDGESRRLTVFFCDLQQFSSVAEQLNPKQLAALLNEYFTEMTEVLYRHGATIDKYIGDSIMAFWGAPLPVPDHAHRAILAAFEMHKVIEGLVARFAKRGWPAPNLGIGINTGLMNVGNMGSKYRIAYTVVGDAVNLAARLESLTRTYQVPTIVGETTRSECADVIFRTLDIVQVRGKHNLTRIYQPLCLESEMNDELRQKLKMHERAVELYLDGSRTEAVTALERMKTDWPDDDFYPAMLHKLENKESQRQNSGDSTNFRNS